MVNRYLPHVLILPEDDATRQLANGFQMKIDWSRQRQMQVLPEAGGWTNVLDLFESEHVTEMDRCPNRYMILLIDFDGKRERLQYAINRIPGNLSGRVFILGALTQPEALRQAISGTYETIGKAMADDCRDNTDTIWGHALLCHNAGELDRLRQHVSSILFPQI